MTKDDVKKIMDAVEDGCMVRIEGSKFVDGFASLFVEDDGKIWIESDVWDARPLIEYPPHKIKVYRPVDLWA